MVATVPRLPDPELTPGWWKSVCPDGVRGRELDRALRELERAEKDFEKDRSSSDKIARAVKSLTKAVSRTTRECDDDEHEDVIDALEELVELAEERLEEAEEEAEDPLFDTQRLREQMRFLRTMPMTFALGLGRGDEIYFTLDRYASGEHLMDKLKGASGCGFATHGVARAEGKVLYLDLQGRPLSGLKSRMREFLRDHQPLPMVRFQLGKPEEEEEAPGPAATGARSASGARPRGEALAFARKVAKAVQHERTKLEALREKTFARLDAVEHANDSSATSDARQHRREIDVVRDEGKKRVVRVTTVAKTLLADGSNEETRAALEKAALRAMRAFQRLRQEIDEAVEWLEERGA